MNNGQVQPNVVPGKRVKNHVVYYKKHFFLELDEKGKPRKSYTNNPPKYKTFQELGNAEEFAEQVALSELEGHDDVALCTIWE